MASYLGKHAEYYDIFYQDKPYAQEAAFVHEYLQRYSQEVCKSLLELACGTGRHAFELEKLGYEILATDYSSDLLNVARQNAAARESGVEFALQDMRSLAFPGKKFDAAYCLFDSIGYVRTNQAIGQVLDGVHAHLKSRGIFIFEFWHAAAMLKKFEAARERHWKTAAGELTRVALTRLDIPNQLAEVTYKIDETGESSIHHIEETQVNRYFLVQEMVCHLESHRFKPLEFLPAYETDGTIGEDTWHILVIAQKMQGK
jgi:SAM-dependent methyltransferase